MEIASTSGKSVLQRRSSLSNSLQALLDGTAIIGITWGLVQYHIGQFTYTYAVFLLLLMGSLAVVYDQFGLYRSNTTFTRKALTLFKAWTVTFLMVMVIGFLAKQTETYSRVLVAELYGIGLLAQLALHLGMRFLQRHWIRTHAQQDNVLIVGHGRLANYLCEKINSNPWLGQKVVGNVALDQRDRDSIPKPTGKHPQVLGQLEDVPRLLNDYHVTTVYIVTPLESSKVLENIYFTLLDRHVTVHWVPDIFSLRLVNHNVKEIAGIPVLTLSETPLIGTRYLTKSIEDTLLASLILLLISPLLLVIALAIKLDSPGPVFFRQARAGWNGKTFRIWKFRSMVVHQPQGARLQQAQKNDPRITRVGAFIRKTSLDELPQIFNVLAGEMSLVGPRPHAIQHDEEYSQRIADYFARHNIKPGITGLAQVRGHRGETRDIDQMIQRIESDIEYINNWSIWLDLSILLRTTGAFTGKNAY